MAESMDQVNPYQAPHAPVEIKESRGAARTPWEWATNVLLGLLFGVIMGGLYYEPWNEPIHWVTVVLHFIVTPLYLVSYALLGRGFLRRLVWAICVVNLFTFIGYQVMSAVIHPSHQFVWK